MTGFKVGDKVRIARALPGMESWIGLTGAVVHVVNGKTKVGLDDGHRRPWGEGDFYWTADRLEKVESPKFKVGDKVRRKSSSAYWTVGTIVEERTPGRIYDVRPDNGFWHSGSSANPGCATYYADNLILVDRPVSQEFKLRHGDKIRNNRTGRIGNVVYGQDEVLWVVDSSYCESTGATVAEVEGYEELHPGTYEVVEKGSPF